MRIWKKRRPNVSRDRRRAELVVDRYGHLSAQQWKQRIPGGKARHKGPRDFDEGALLEGILVELEHTSDPLVAMEITMDHLFEDPNYYPKLATIHHETNARRANPREISAERARQGACVLGKWAWDRDRSVCGPDAPDPSQAARELAERRWTRHERRIQARLLRGET